MVTVILVGEKQGNKLLVMERSSAHHEGTLIYKAKARLSYYCRLCHTEPVIVTVKGVPAFQMVPLEEK